MNKNFLAIMCFAAAVIISVPVFIFATSKNTDGAAKEPAQQNAQVMSAVNAATPKPAEKTTAAVIGGADGPTKILVAKENAKDYFYELTESPKYEMRGVWIAAVKNIDMPSGMDEAAFKKWAANACQAARDRNMNAVVFQIKPTADALYKSKLSPWSKYIAGKEQGTDPGYDPLGIMVETAHSMGIELHAWINPYRVTMTDEKLDTLSKESPAIKNPSWVIGYNKQFYLNPGLPEVRKYLVDSVAEIVEGYDVDAIHMDDYFYPYPTSGIEFQDGEAFKKYGAGFKSVGDWRRNNVNILVKEINDKIKEIKPYVQYGISPFGVWRNIASDPSGSNTKAGVENYDSLYADTRQWLKDGSIDYLVPQIYWSRISEAANYTVLLNWWNDEILKYTMGGQGAENAHPINLYVGTADYKVGTKNDAAWEKSAAEISGQITDNRAKEAVTGQIHYNFSSVTANPLEYFNAVKQENYASVALTPPCPWNGLEKAEKPEAVEVEFTKSGLFVRINPGAAGNARKYVIYRFDASAPAEYKNENIIAVVYHSQAPSFLDSRVAKGKGYNYSVRAVSGAGIESDEAVNSGVAWF